MSRHHKFYVYYEENRIMARRSKEAPIVAEECKTPQEAHDKVQAIVNPEGKPFSAFGPRGFLEDSFQSKVSGNCEAYVTAAYARQKK